MDRELIESDRWRRPADADCIWLLFLIISLSPPPPPLPPSSYFYRMERCGGMRRCRCDAFHRPLDFHFSWVGCREMARQSRRFPAALQSGPLANQEARMTEPFICITACNSWKWKEGERETQGTGRGGGRFKGFAGMQAPTRDTELFPTGLICIFSVNVIVVVVLADSNYSSEFESES